MKKEKPFDLAIGEIIDFKIQSTLERGKEHEVSVKVTGKGKYIFWTLLLIDPLKKEQWWVDNSSIDLVKNGGKRELRKKVVSKSSWNFPIFDNAPLGEYTTFLGLYQDTYELPTVNRRLLDYRLRKLKVVKNPKEQAVDELPASRVNIAGVKSEQEYFEIIRNRIIWCICHNLISNDRRTFHAADMISECAKGFYDKRGIEEYKTTGKHEYYTPVLEKIYKPLVDGGFLEEYEKNTYRIPKGSKLDNICKTQLSDGRSYVIWDEINWG